MIDKGQLYYSRQGGNLYVILSKMLKPDRYKIMYQNGEVNAKLDEVILDDIFLGDTPSEARKAYKCFEYEISLIERGVIEYGSKN